MIQRITLKKRKIYLVGTAHVSEESVQEVEQAYKEITPDQVCVELDSKRYQTITNSQVWRQTDFIQLLKQGKGMLMLSQLVLSSFQRRAGGNIQPGQEFLRAIKLAQKDKIPLSFCDRPVDTTLLRAWRRSGIWTKNKILSSLIASLFSSQLPSQEEIEKMKQNNEVETMMTDLSTYLPSVKSVLIEERDRYLAQKIYESGGTKVLAVLGLGHLKGVGELLEKIDAQEIAIDTSSLLTLPPPGKIGKVLGVVLTVLILGLIGSGFLQGEWRGVLDNVLLWVGVNGSLASLGALIGGAHIVTIIASFFSAPLTSLTPGIGVGIVAGVIETILRKPRVSDFSDLQKDLKRFKSMYRNRVSRILIILFLTTLGSAVGTFVAIPFLFPQLS